jgi:pimeloyl-ACP methyl ester carboxylesterase
MTYAPFDRGPFPVGVRSSAVVDSGRRDRRLPVEYWYPATDEYRGHDLTPATQDAFELAPAVRGGVQQAVRDAQARAGKGPLVVFSHGNASHRRQSTYLCTHLASHGYAVAAPDHTGNTAVEMFRRAFAGEPLNEPIRDYISRLLVDRPADITAVIDHVHSGAAAISARVEGQPLAVVGHSFGGWTALATAGRDPRVSALVALSPAGAVSELDRSGRLLAALSFSWPTPVPSLFITGARDAIVAADGVRDLFGRVRSPARLVVVANAGHMHFCDQVEKTHELFRSIAGSLGMQARNMAPVSELCPGKHGHEVSESLTLAHLDQHLRGCAQAAEFLAGDHWHRSLRARGIEFSWEDRPTGNGS